MSTSFASTAALRSEQNRLQTLRAEAAVEPDAIMYDKLASAKLLPIPPLP